jgi:hypothetical protein
MALVVTFVLKGSVLISNVCSNLKSLRLFLLVWKYSVARETGWRF